MGRDRLQTRQQFPKAPDTCSINWRTLFKAIGLPFRVLERPIGGKTRQRIELESAADQRLNVAYGKYADVVLSLDMRLRLTGYDPPHEPHPAVVTLFRHWTGVQPLAERNVEALKTELRMVYEKAGL